MDLRVVKIDDVGLIAIRAFMGAPDDIPPKIPPALLDKNSALPSDICISSPATSPGTSDNENPAPISTALTAFIDIIADEISESSLPYRGCPIPVGMPVAITSRIAPAEEPLLRISSR